MARYMMQNIGSVVPGGDGSMDEGKASEHLHPGTDAGQAMIVAGLAFVLLFFVVDGEGGFAARAGRVLQFVAIVLFAEVVGNWGVRMYALRHPDGPFAKGLALDV